MPEGVLFQIGKFDGGPNQLLMFPAMAVLFLVAWKLCNMYWKRRLTEWAESEGAELVSFRGAWFNEGPSAWTAAATSICSAW